MNTRASSFVQTNLLVCILSAISAYGQGPTIVFCNHCLPSPPDRLVRDVNGTPLVGTNYLAQLYVGGTPETLVAHTAAPAQFRAAPTSMPGAWVSGNRTLVAPGPGPIVLEVRVWDSAAGATYEQASQNTTGLQYGRSASFNYEPCGTPIPMPNCELMLGFLGFTLRTNAALPPDRTLTIRENGTLVDVLYQGTHTIQAAPSIRGPWATVYTSTAPFTDPASGTNSVRFYRMMDEPGPVYSLNAVGYYRLELCAGLSLVANQLHHVGGNTVDNVLGAPPEGTRVYKFRPDLGVYMMRQFVDGAWEGDDDGMTLGPGEGAFVWSPTVYSKRFLGEVPGLAQVSIPNGTSILSSPLPERGPLNLAPPGGLGFPLRNGDVIFQWSCGRGTYRFNQYIDGQWEGDDAGTPPVMEIGEAFFLIRTGGSFPGTWTRSFSAGP